MLAVVDGPNYWRVSNWITLGSGAMRCMRHEKEFRAPFSCDACLLDPAPAEAERAEFPYLDGMPTEVEHERWMVKLSEQCKAQSDACVALADEYLNPKTPRKKPGAKRAAKTRKPNTAAAIALLNTAAKFIDNAIKARRQAWAATSNREGNYVTAKYSAAIDEMTKRRSAVTTLQDEARH